MDADVAHSFYTHMRKQLPDTDHLITTAPTKALYISYLEQLDLGQAKEVARHFQDKLRLPSIAEFESERERRYPSSTQRIDKVAEISSAKEHLAKAREALKNAGKATIPS